MSRVEDVAQMFRDGSSTKYIAEALGLQRNTVIAYKWKARKEGLLSPYRANVPADTIAAMVREGLTSREAADRLCVSIASVYGGLCNAKRLGKLEKGEGFRFDPARAEVLKDKINLVVKTDSMSEAARRLGISRQAVEQAMTEAREAGMIRERRVWDYGSRFPRELRR